MAPRIGRPPKYDWGTIIDGDAWIARQGEDFDCTLASFKALLRYHARKRGIRVRTKEIENRTAVWFQFRMSR